MNTINEYIDNTCTLSYDYFMYILEFIDLYEDWYTNNIDRYNILEKTEMYKQLYNSKLKNNIQEILILNKYGSYDKHKIIHNIMYLDKHNCEKYNMNKMILIDNNIIYKSIENENIKLKYLLKNNKLKINIGRIYNIEYKNDKNIRYIGSTIKTLKNRFSMHKNKYNKWLENDDYAKCEIYEYFKIYDINNFSISLLEEYKIYNTEHLKIYEQIWLNKLTNINTNKSFNKIDIDKYLLYYESIL